MAIKISGTVVVSDSRNLTNVNVATANTFIGDGSQLTGIVTTGPLIYNSVNVTSNIFVNTGFNAISVGPINIQAGNTVTVSSNQRWVIV